MILLLQSNLKINCILSGIGREVYIGIFLTIDLHIHRVKVYSRVRKGHILFCVYSEKNTVINREICLTVLTDCRSV